jgi:hypothetical protein
LYQILKIVPVCGGGSEVMVDGSTCGRAGRRLRRINLVFFCGGSTSVEAFCVAKAWERSFEEEGGRSSKGGEAGRVEVSTSAMLSTANDKFFEQCAMTVYGFRSDFR